MQSLAGYYNSTNTSHSQIQELKHLPLIQTGLSIFISIMLDLFAKQRQCLLLMGHNFVRDKSELLKKWHNIKYVSVLLLVVSAQWPIMNYTIYYIDDLQLATASMSISYTNVLTVVKITTFLFYKWRFAALMEKLESMYHECKYAVWIYCLPSTYRHI